MAQSGWSENKKLITILGLIGLAFYLGVMNQVMKNYTPPTKTQENKPKTKAKLTNDQPSPSLKLLSSPNPSLKLTTSPSPLPKIKSPDPYDSMVTIGNGVTDNSNVSVFKNKDSSIDVTNNIQLAPEVEIKWAMDVKAKEWTTKFISRAYNSGLKIRYVLVTVSFLNTGRPATRVGLGINQANKFSDADWKSFEPTMLCSVLEEIQVGDDVDPGSPSFNPSNWAFAKNCD